MKAKEMFEKKGFKQTYFNNDKDSQEIAIRYEKIIPLVSVGEITFICYKNRKYDSNGVILNSVYFQGDLRFYNQETSKYEVVCGLVINTTLLNAINKQVEELKQEMVK